MAPSIQRVVAPDNSLSCRHTLLEHIFLNFQWKEMKFSGHVQKVLNGLNAGKRVSDFFYLFPSLNSIKCRKSFMKKIAKSSQFLA